MADQEKQDDSEHNARSPPRSRPWQLRSRCRRGCGAGREATGPTVKATVIHRHAARLGDPVRGPDRAARERARSEPAPARHRGRRVGRRLVRPRHVRLDRRHGPRRRRHRPDRTVTARSRRPSRHGSKAEGGDDTLIGGSGNEILDGGSGNDFVDGNGGADTAFLGKGDDTFVWDPGDGSDVVEGGKRPRHPWSSTVRAATRSSTRHRQLRTGDIHPEPRRHRHGPRRHRGDRRQGPGRHRSGHDQRHDRDGPERVNVDLAAALGGSTSDGRPTPSPSTARRGTTRSRWTRMGRRRGQRPGRPRADHSRGSRQGHARLRHRSLAPTTSRSTRPSPT